MGDWLQCMVSALHPTSSDPFCPFHTSYFWLLSAFVVNNIYIPVTFLGCPEFLEPLCPQCKLPESPHLLEMVLRQCGGARGESPAPHLQLLCQGHCSGSHLPHGVWEATLHRAPPAAAPAPGTLSPCALSLISY